MPNRAPLPPVPQPTRIIFDPFNSSSTGHQRAENRLSGSTSWRDSRTYKLSHQFGDTTGGGGTNHLSDQVGAGSENFGKDGRKQNGDWEIGAPGLREPGWQDIRGFVDTTSRKPEAAPIKDEKTVENATVKRLSPESSLSTKEIPKRRIFTGVTVYINGSTAPLVGDHKLKHLLAQHGANVSLALGRRTVTHVILGETNGTSRDAKGLAAGKIQKEMTRIGGNGVKYVSARWVLESIEAGKRLPEAQFSSLNLNGRGSKGVYGMLRKDRPSTSPFVGKSNKDTADG